MYIQLYMANKTRKKEINTCKTKTDEQVSIEENLYNPDLKLLACFQVI